MKFKIILFLLFSSFTFAQYTSEHTGEHIDSMITKVEDITAGEVTQPFDTLEVTNDASIGGDLDVAGTVSVSGDSIIFVDGKSIIYNNTIVEEGDTAYYQMVFKSVDPLSASFVTIKLDANGFAYNENDYAPYSTFVVNNSNMTYYTSEHRFSLATSSGTARIVVNRLSDSWSQRILFGDGTPIDVEAGYSGSMYLRSDGGVGTTFYIKESGASSYDATGWRAIGLPTDILDADTVGIENNLNVGGDLNVGGTATIGTYTLPNTDGANGQLLKTNGSGVLSWQSDATGAGGSAYTDSVTHNGRHIPGDSLTTIDEMAALYVTLAGSSVDSVISFAGNVASGEAMSVSSIGVLSDGEIVVRDALDNVTVISPHPLEFDGRWMYMSQNDGVYTVVDWEKFIMAMEEVTGEKYLYKGSLEKIKKELQ